MAVVDSPRRALLHFFISVVMLCFPVVLVLVLSMALALALVMVLVFIVVVLVNRSRVFANPMCAVRYSSGASAVHTLDNSAQWKGPLDVYCVIMIVLLKAQLTQVPCYSVCYPFSSKVIR